jgi:sarcosine oxidase subunit gamma
LTQKGSGFVHDLKPTNALGGAQPNIDTIGTITISENSGVALASVAARMGGEKKTAQVLKKLLGAVPDPGRAQLHDPEAGFWMGPDQWMIGAPIATHELIADQLKGLLGDAASVTEQTGAWAVFDVTGAAMPDMMERLCAIPIRQMVAGDARRTVIHHLSCFVIQREADDHVRIFGPRASAQSLHHALTTAARSAA